VAFSVLFLNIIAISAPVRGSN